MSWNVVSQQRLFPFQVVAVGSPHTSDAAGLAGETGAAGALCASSLTQISRISAPSCCHPPTFFSFFKTVAPISQSPSPPQVLPPSWMTSASTGHPCSSLASQFLGFLVCPALLLLNHWSHNPLPVLLSSLTSLTQASYSHPTCLFSCSPRYHPVPSSRPPVYGRLSFLTAPSSSSIGSLVHRFLTMHWAPRSSPFHLQSSTRRSP